MKIELSLVHSLRYSSSFSTNIFFHVKMIYYKHMEQPSMQHILKKIFSKKIASHNFCQLATRLFLINAMQKDKAAPTIDRVVSLA